MSNKNIIKLTFQSNDQEDKKNKTSIAFNEKQGEERDKVSCIIHNSVLTDYIKNISG